MKIGFCVEGGRDRALVTGLAERWCAGVELIPGSFRGSTGLSLRREIPRVILELEEKQADIIVILSDSNSRGWRKTDNPEWRDVLRGQDKRIPLEKRDRVVSGVADRNVECWLVADAHHAARELGLPLDEIQLAEDPKSLVNRALGGDEGKTARFVSRAPLREWIANAPSFERFYEGARDVASRQGCSLPDERAPA